jgi:hypothetical protein
MASIGMSKRKSGVNKKATSNEVTSYGPGT